MGCVFGISLAEIFFCGGFGKLNTYDGWGGGGYGWVLGLEGLSIERGFRG
jgi:hypothetical protein